MRKLHNHNKQNTVSVDTSLGVLSSKDSGVDEYREAFFKLGSELGILIQDKYKTLGSTKVVCLNEDADWLTKGLIDNLGINKISLSVYWSDRIKYSEKPKIEYAPIVYAYEEPINDCDSLIIVKSIISTSCVVKTQLLRLVGKINPKHIIIAAPVMYKDAEKSLRNGFLKDVSDRMDFVTFAIDDKRDALGIVEPGVGGWVFKRLGLGNDFSEVNKYIPDLVKSKLSLLK